MKNQIFSKKKNDDGSDYIDPITKDFVMELIEETIIEVPLQEAIDNKIKEIDNNTENLIYNGFEYNGLQFSLSTNAQINWSNLPNLPEFIFPLTVLSKNDDTYKLEYAEVMNFYLTAVNGKNMHLQSGNILKQELLKLKDSESVYNFKDDRLGNQVRQFKTKSTKKEKPKSNFEVNANESLFQKFVTYIKNLF